MAELHSPSVTTAFRRSASSKELEFAAAAPQAASPASTRAPSELSSETSAESSGLIILDWDDTLFPTTMLYPGQGAVAKRVGNPEAMKARRTQLAQHAAVVEALLREAAGIGKVCIVTLAETGWVEASADRYLPSLNLHQLLAELSISVYYARDFRPAVPVAQDELRVVMKSAAMAAALEASGCSSALSIGDLSVESDALHALRHLKSRKTVKLMAQPDGMTLTVQLIELLPCLAGMQGHLGDFDVVAEQLADFKSSCFQLFRHELRIVNSSFTMSL